MKVFSNSSVISMGATVLVPPFMSMLVVIAGS